MNPELMRNLWLEASPRRLAIMGGILAFMFATVWVTAPSEHLRALSATAEALFYVLVVVWGTRSAASAVVDEIASRTWDLQRLSAISPWEMVWGKLLGATSYVWFGGLICLVPITMYALQDRGVEAAILQLTYFLSIGLIAHGAALLSSMVAVRRRMGQTRLGTFLYLIIGLLSASYAWTIWAMASPGALGITPWGAERLVAITWYGMEWDAPLFLMASLAIAFGWILAGTHQFMRYELAAGMNPFVWIGFLLYLVLYTVGFSSPDYPVFDEVTKISGAGRSIGWIAATGAVLVATYVSLVAMPKELVRMRWLASQAAQGRLFSFLEGLPGWAYGFIATAVTAAIMLMASANDGASATDQNALRLLVFAALGELARNCGIFVFFNMLPGQRRGDFAAILALVLIYGVLPLFLAGLNSPSAAAFISPWAELAASYPSPETVVSPWAMWIQAAIIWALAMLRLGQART